MAGINKVILIGHLGRDPEIRYSQSGMAVARFSLATTEKWSGEEKTEWHNVVCFGKLAEIVGEYLSKGRLVFVEGRLQTRSWDDQNETKRYATEIIANVMQMLGSGGNPAKTATNGPAISNPSKYADPFAGGNDAPPADDDIPF